MALDALMREKDGVWIAYGDGSGRSGRGRCRRQGAGAARQPVLSASPAVARSRRNTTPTTAGLPTRACGRSAIWSMCARSFAATTGPPTRRSTPGSPRPSMQELPHRRHAGVHPGLPSGAGRRAAARAAAAGAHRAVLAHPVALSRSAAHLSVAARDPRRAAGQRSGGVSARARSPQLRARGRGRARRRGRLATASGCGSTDASAP